MPSRLKLLGNSAIRKAGLAIENRPTSFHFHTYVARDYFAN